MKDPLLLFFLCTTKVSQSAGFIEVILGNRSSKIQVLLWDISLSLLCPLKVYRTFLLSFLFQLTVRTSKRIEYNSLYF